MAEPVEDQSGTTSPRNEGAQYWTHIRQRARVLLRAQSQHIRGVEAQLTQQVEALVAQVNSEQSQAECRVAELQERIAELEQRPGPNDARREAEALLEEARGALSDALREQQDLKSQLRRRDDEDRVYRERLRDDSSSANTAAEVAELTAERDSLRSQLDETQQGLDASRDESRLNEMRQRFEKAVQEIRELKRQNAELNGELGGEPQPCSEPASDSFDWETQKQRLLAQLESDFDTADPSQARDKLTVEGAIRITDEVVARKEQEIGELRQLLEDQSGKVGDVAVGATAVAQLLDDDELVQAERENLKQLQDEWREKLRRAEVDISIDRAKLARERATLEDRIAALESEQAACATVQNSPSPAETKKAPGGNWLARLGLKEEND